MPYMVTAEDVPPITSLLDPPDYDYVYIGDLPYAQRVELVEEMDRLAAAKLMIHPSAYKDAQRDAQREIKERDREIKDLKSENAYLWRERRIYLSELRRELRGSTTTLTAATAMARAAYLEKRVCQLTEEGIEQRHKILELRRENNDLCDKLRETETEHTPEVVKRGQQLLDQLTEEGKKTRRENLDLRRKLHQLQMAKA